MAALAYIEGQQIARGRKSVNTSEYALQMCRPVTLQVNTLADGQLGTGWPHRLAPGESGGEGRRRDKGWGVRGKEEEEWVKKKRRGLYAKGPEPRASHPEDLCSLAGWIRGDRESEGGNKSKGKEKKVHGRVKDSEGGLGLIVPLLSLLHVASKGAPAVSANFRLAQTCELLGAN